ncbi:MAG TPA: EAL domain-containing protein [Polyangiaceae bacterium]|nr:EAL domain-containing protein [Polyangiaceae bacterium]
MKDSAPDPAVTVPPSSRPRVLVVDDEEPLLRALGRALGQAQMAVSTASTGEAALQLLSNQAFDAVLTDIQMPGLTGVQLLRAVRQRDLEVPVVLMTGSPDVGTAADAVRFGAAEYLVKPLSFDALEKTLRRAIALGALARTKRESLRLLGSEFPEAGDRAGLEVTLDRALGSMWMAYQPIVSAETKTVIAYEALLRSGEPALPHPGAVLDAAERLGRLPDVGRAVRQLAPAPMADVRPLLFINLHAADLADEDLFAPASPLANIAPRVVLEITERASLDEMNDVRSRVSRLRAMGFRIAIDDLGAGYAGLTSFALLEPEFVKLDMSLVRDVHRSALKRKLVRSMTALCKDMRIAVVAEGIETKEERDAVVELGCDLLQGYLLAKPGKPFPEVSAW